MRKLLALAVLAVTSISVAYASGWVAVYALIDKVVLEPNADKPQRIQIWGVFRLAGADAPQRGYLYFALPPGTAGQNREAMATKEWNDLKSAAGKRQVVAFGEISFGNPKGNVIDGLATVRRPDQRPEKPDIYNFGTGVVNIRSDTDYAPVKSLVDFR